MIVLYNRSVLLRKVGPVHPRPGADSVGTEKGRGGWAPSVTSRRVTDRTNSEGILLLSQK